MVTAGYIKLPILHTELPCDKILPIRSNTSSTSYYWERCVYCVEVRDGRKLFISRIWGKCDEDRTYNINIWYYSGTGWTEYVTLKSWLDVWRHGKVILELIERLESSVVSVCRMMREVILSYRGLHKLSHVA